MKMITWNCNGALRKKVGALEKLKADVLIIQECEDPKQTTDTSYQKWASNYLWIGNNKHKGLGVFAKDKLKLELLGWNDGGLKYFIPCKVNGTTILAAWCYGTSGMSLPYIGQLWQYIQAHKSKLRDCLIAGDFNSNVFWDKPRREWNHSDVVRELKEIDIESIYHSYFDQAQGNEALPTFYLQKNLTKPYHIDYVFASSSFRQQLSSLSIGLADEWMTLSDHMPICCHFNL
jgi:exonuclease III